MNRTLIAVSFLALAACESEPSMRVSDSNPAASAQVAATKLVYPRAERQGVVEDYHGTQVADPYRWLEDPDSAPTRAWITQENALTQSWIQAVPEREKIEKRLTELWSCERFGVPFKKGGRYFFYKNDGLQNQAVLMVADALDAKPRVLLDPNTLRADGTISVTDQSVSDDGKYLGYMLSEAGSDWNTIRVRDIATGKDTDDVILWVKFSTIAWSPDSKGFYYSTFPVHDTTGTIALADQKLMHHSLGANADKDVVTYARPDHPQWGFGGGVTDDGELLVISQSEGTEQKNRVFVQDLRAAASPITALFDAFDAEYDVLGKQGSRVFVRTDNHAPNARIIAVDLDKTKPADWIEIVPEAREAIESAVFAGERLIVTYLKDGANEVRVFALDGKLVDTPRLPGIGSIAGFSGKSGDDETFFAFTSFTTPTEIWRYDLATKALKLWRAPKVPFEPRDFVTEQVFFTSKDGTRVPLFVSHRADVKLTRDTPTLLYGYGGFNVAIKPAYTAATLAWMERGGCYASANLRGGSEYGRDWHEAGTKERKQNVFDDFIAAAEFLIAKGWTSTPKLAIHGRSNGGLLVGACLTQRPDLFGAAIPGVGVLDMLRYHKFTIGWAWASDYGRSDDVEAFQYLMRYSPLHNVKHGAHYPATLITTGDHDDRVVPAHSFKFAAELQQAQGGDAPILIRIETRGGHGAGKPTSMQIEELADEYTFLLRALGMSTAH
jgi:prolyl oligopeptidase